MNKPSRDPHLNKGLASECGCCDIFHTYIAHQADSRDPVVAAGQGTQPRKENEAPTLGAAREACVCLETAGQPPDPDVIRTRANAEPDAQAEHDRGAQPDEPRKQPGQRHEQRPADHPCDDGRLHRMHRIHVFQPVTDIAAGGRESETGRDERYGNRDEGYDERSHGGSFC